MFLSPSGVQHCTQSFYFLLFLCSRFSQKGGKNMTQHEIPNLYTIIDISYYYHFYQSRVRGFTKAIFVDFQRYKKNEYSCCSCKCNIFSSYEYFLLPLFQRKYFLVIQRFTSSVTFQIKQKLFSKISCQPRCVCDDVYPLEQLTVFSQSQVLSLWSTTPQIQKSQGTSNFTYILKQEKEWSKAFSFPISSM